MCASGCAGSHASAIVKARARIASVCSCMLVMFPPSAAYLAQCGRARSLVGAYIVELLYLWRACHRVSLPAVAAFIAVWVVSLFGLVPEDLLVMPGRLPLARRRLGVVLCALARGWASCLCSLDRPVARHVVVTCAADGGRAVQPRPRGTNRGVCMSVCFVRSVLLPFHRSGPPCPPPFPRIVSSARSLYRTGVPPCT